MHLRPLAPPGSLTRWAIPWFLGSLIALAFGWLAFLAWSSERAQYQDLHRHGIQTTARITDVDHDLAVTLTVRYTDAGRTWSVEVNPWKVEDWQDGSLVPITFVRRHRDSAVYAGRGGDRFLRHSPRISAVISLLAVLLGVVAALHLLLRLTLLRFLATETAAGGPIAVSLVEGRARTMDMRTNRVVTWKLLGPSLPEGITPAYVHGRPAAGAWVVLRVDDTLRWPLDACADVEPAPLRAISAHVPGLAAAHADLLDGYATTLLTCDDTRRRSAGGVVPTLIKRHVRRRLEELGSIYGRYGAVIGSDAAWCSNAADDCGTLAATIPTANQWTSWLRAGVAGAGRLALGALGIATAGALIRLGVSRLSRFVNADLTFVYQLLAVAIVLGVAWGVVRAHRACSSAVRAAFVPGAPRHDEATSPTLDSRRGSFALENRLFALLGLRKRDEAVTSAMVSVVVYAIALFGSAAYLIDADARAGWPVPVTAVVIGGMITLYRWRRTYLWQHVRPRAGQPDQRSAITEQ